MVRRISAAPVSGELQNFCGSSQWWVAEFLRHQSVVSCRIFAAPVSGELQNFCGTSQWWLTQFLRHSVSGGLQNFCGTSQWWVAEFLRHQSAVACTISAAPVNNWSLLKYI